MCQPNEFEIELLESDAELITRYKEGEQQVANVLFLRYNKKLLEFLLHTTHNHHDAEELCQETLKDAFISLDKFIDRGFGIKPWLFKIAVHKRNKYYKVLCKHRHISLDLIPETPCDSPKSSDIFIDKADLSMLQEKHRQVLVFYYYDNLTFEQISKKMQVSITKAFHLRNEGIDFLRHIANNRP